MPLNRSQRPLQTLFDILEDCLTEIDIVLDETHTAITRPTALVIIADDIVIRRIRIGAEVSLDEISRFLRCEAE